MFDGHPLFGAPRPPLFANARNNPPTKPVPGTFAPGLFGAPLAPRLLNDSAGTAAARYQAAAAEARAARARNRADLGLNPGAGFGVRPMFEPPKPPVPAPVPLFGPPAPAPVPLFGPPNPALREGGVFPVFGGPPAFGHPNTQPPRQQTPANKKPRRQSLAVGRQTYPEAPDWPNASSIGYPGYIYNPKPLSTDSSYGDIYLLWKDGKKYIAKIFKLNPGADPNHPNYNQYNNLVQISKNQNLRDIVPKPIKKNNNKGFIMEYLSSENNWMTLQNAVRATPSVRKKRIWFANIKNVVDVLHRNGWVHKDLKPDNIMVNIDTDEIKLIDLGLAANSRDPNPRYCGYLAGWPMKWINQGKALRRSDGYPFFNPRYTFTFDDFVEADNYAVNGYVKSSMGL
jgi:hypothetical protein